MPHTSPMDTIGRENDNGITAQFSCFSKVGDGRWSGTVLLKDGGGEYEIEELTNSWRVTPVGSPDGGTSVTERLLERALLKAMKKTAAA